MATDEARLSNASRSDTFPNVSNCWSVKNGDWNSVRESPFTSLMSPTKRAEEIWEAGQGMHLYLRVVFKHLFLYIYQSTQGLGISQFIYRKVDELGHRKV